MRMDNRFIGFQVVARVQSADTKKAANDILAGL